MGGSDSFTTKTKIGADTKPSYKRYVSRTLGWIDGFKHPTYPAGSLWLCLVAVMILSTAALPMIEASQGVLFYSRNSSQIFTSPLIDDTHIGNTTLMSSGLSPWTQVVPFNVAGKNFILWYEQGRVGSWYSEITGPSTLGNTQKFADFSDNWTHIIPLVLNGKQHFIFYIRSTGWLGNWEVNDDHSLGASTPMGIISSGWDQIVPVYKFGSPHLLFYRRSDGLGILAEVNTQKLLGNQTTMGGFETTWAHIASTSSAGNTQIFFQRDNGQAFRFPLNSNNTLGPAEYLGFWGSWTQIKPFNIPNSSPPPSAGAPPPGQNPVESIGTVVTWNTPPAVANVAVIGTPLPGLWLGNFRPDGNGLKANGSFLLMGVWWNVDATIDPLAKVLHIDSLISLPYPQISDDLQQPISQGFQVSLDENGNVVGGGLGVFLPGPLKMGKIKGKQLNLYNLNVQIQPTQDLYALAGEIEFQDSSLKGSCNLKDLMARFKNLDPLSNKIKEFRRIGAGFQIRNNSLDQISMNANNLLIPMGNSGVYLDLVSAAMGGFSDPSNLYLGGKIRIIGGCPLPIVGPPVGGTLDGRWYTGTGAFNLRGQAQIFRITVAGAEVNYQPVGQSSSVSIKGFAGIPNLYESNMSININDGNVSGSSQGRVVVPSTLPIVGPIFGGSGIQTQTSFDNNGFRGAISLPITKEIPEKCVGGYSYRACITKEDCWDTFLGRVCSPFDVCTTIDVPRVCTPAIPAQKASFSFEYKFANNALTFGTVTTAANRRVNSLKPFQSMVPTTEDGNSTMHFMGNWKLLDRISYSRGLRPKMEIPDDAWDTFEIPENIPGLILRLWHETPDVEGHFSIQLPDGSLLSTHEGQLPNGYEFVNGFSEIDEENNESFLLLISPPAGTYQIAVENPLEIGDHELEAIVEDGEPLLEIESIEALEDDGVYEVHWIDTDLEGDAIVNVYLDQDDEDENGVFIGSIESNEEQEAFIIDTRLIDQLPPGEYFVLMGIDDKVHPVRWVYGDDPIFVIDPEAPEPVTELASVEGDQSLTVRWKPSATKDVTSYQIVMTSDDEFSDFDDSRIVDSNTLSTTINGLKNGQAYLVSVVAIREGNHVSEPAVIHRVTPSRGYGENLPRITSVSDGDATVGHRWIYLPTVYNPDIIESRPGVFTTQGGNGGPPNEPVQAIYNVSWTLVDGPEGLSLDPDQGFMQWVPQQGQEGLHQVEIMATELLELSNGTKSRNRTNTATQIFEIEVLPAHNLGGLEAHPYTFISTPKLRATAGTTYRYQVGLLGPESGFELEIFHGPEGMYIEGDEVIWEVPEDAIGDDVLLCAVFEDGTTVEHDYFLHVDRPDNRITKPVTIIDVYRDKEGVKLNWSGDGPFFQIQRKGALGEENWINLGEPVSNGFFEDFVDADPPAGKAFYRIIPVMNQ